MKRIIMSAVMVLLSIIAVFIGNRVYFRFTSPSTPTASLATTTTTPITTTIPTENEQREFSFTEAQQQRLVSMLQQYGGNISLYFEDLHSGYVFSYQDEILFTAASIVNAPYCMYLLDMAIQGKCDLNEKITYTPDIPSDGTGIVKNAAFGTRFTVSQLIECAIRHSDNIALRMLRDAYPAAGFLQYSKTLGIENTDAIHNITGARINAKDTAVYMKAIYAFIQNNSDEGTVLREHMMNTINPMFTSSYDLIRKYGWAPKAFHEAAIIDAPHPYILVFLTDHSEGTDADFQMFRTISQTIEKLSVQSDI